MVNYWKSKVLPKIKKVFENKDKIAATEACKVFDEAKEQYSQEFEEKKSEYEPKVIEIYEASPPEIKTLVKGTPKASALKKNSPAVQKFLDELAKIEFPGSKSVCEATTKFGPSLVPGPVFFLFEKVSTFIPAEEVKTEEVVVVEEKKTEEEATSGAVETKEKEIVVEEPAVVPEKTEAVVACEPTKVEEATPAAAPAAAPAATPVVEPSKP